MAENILRSRGRPQGYKFDRGLMPTEMGPYVGIVVNNVDAIRSGRLDVWIEQFGATNADGTPNLTDTSLWRSVNYCPPFYGATPYVGTTASYGTYPGNRNSYGMWFTPPDVGVKVLCFFVGGDPNQGYYLGCIPEPGINHMIPAIGATSNYVPGNQAQQQAFTNSALMPVTEINEGNPAVNENPKFYNAPKPVQSVLAAELFQQGLNTDPIRGPIKSSSQRESPSSTYGISTPGEPIYQGGMKPSTIRAQLQKGEITAQQAQVIGRKGGHTFVMDDGDLDGNDTLVRIRTAKGHQITMSDNGDTFYIVHANGQTWIELGKQGTVDVYSTNSINLRTQGTLNLHADVDVNINAGNNIKMKANNLFALESAKNLTINADQTLAAYSKQTISVRGDGKLALKGGISTWDGGSTLNFKANQINLNGAGVIGTSTVPNLGTYKLTDTHFTAGKGWVPNPGAINTIVTRAPTHEPFPYHNQGVKNTVNLNDTGIVTDNPTNAPGSSQTPEQAAKSDAAYQTVSQRAVKNGVTAENIANEQPAGDNIGQCTANDLTGMTAQAKANTTAERIKVVGSPYDDQGNLNLDWQLNEDGNPVYVGPDIYVNGVGEYGQSPQALTQTGYLKPGTLNLITEPQLTYIVLNSPNVWTGQLGISSLLGYLNAPVVQNIAQYALLAGAYLGLLNNNILNGDESARYQATFIQPAAQYGVDNVVAWVNGTLEDSAMLDNILDSARQGQYAVDFSQIYFNALNNYNNLPGYGNTVIRTDMDQAVTDIIGNPKIATPVYSDQATGPQTVDVLKQTPDDDSIFRFAPGNPESK